MRSQSIVSLSTLVAALGLSIGPRVTAQAEVPSPWQPGEAVCVLFLGDGGHHQPAARADQVLAPLRERGIDVFYTESLTSLSTEGLRGYHALLVYANHLSIGRAQEQALRAFVANGGGLVAVHCASACFANSPAWIELVGAQFQRHGVGTFRTELSALEHPLTKGFAGFESWDETYVHTRHNEDRTVLEVRVDGEHREPWTWVRTSGKGRVFYTAWGHDQRTWGNPGFQDLLGRGIRWAVGDLEPGRAPAATPFEIVASKSPIPDYPAGRRWGESEEVRTMQAPLPAAVSQGRLVTPPGVRVELFATEPDLKKPIAMAWDARGRLFVAETVDYPNDPQPRGQGHDRIQVCEDTDGDGRADRFTVFADGLSIPTGLVFAGDGLVVVQAPDLLLLRDTDGDDRADERRVLVSGWGTGDTHAGPSNLRYGFDNRVWGTVGYSGFRGQVDGEERRFGSGIWAIGTDGTRFEYLGSTTNNTWGLGFDETGNVFASTANGNPSVHLAIPHRHYERVPGLAAGALQTIADSLAIHPITTAVRQVDYHGKFTAGAGHAIYTARAMPRAWWNRAAFVPEPTGHLAAMFFVEPRGSGFVARSAWNLIASDDQWTAPIQAEVGPDGAVWVIDWYNYIVQHNPTPQGFPTGRGNAYETPLRDKQHGRIYRLVPDGVALPKARDLAGADAATLVRTLDDDNQFWRLTAQRLLLAHADVGIDAPLRARVGIAKLDALGLDPGALHSLWTLHGRRAIDAPESAAPVRGALRHAAASVRAAAWQVLPRSEANLEYVLDRNLLDDVDAKVRLHALLALAEMPRSERAGRAVFQLAQRAADLDDPWLPDALTIAAAQHDVGFLGAALAAARPEPGAASAPPKNLFRNADFEAGEGAAADAWAPRTYSGRGATHAWAEGGRGADGGYCLMIRATQGTDTSWFQDVPVEPGRTYQLRGYIKTQGLARVRGGMGALFNVHGRDQQTHTSNPVHGDADWTLSTLTFDSGSARSVSINCLFGGWGQATGTAWFDDLELVPIDNGMPGPEGKILARVTRSFSARASGPAVVDLVLGLRGCAPSVARSFLEGLANGWPAERQVQLEGAAGAALAAVSRDFDAQTRAALLLLCDKLGARAALRADAEAFLAGLRATLLDAAVDVPERVRAARQLVAMDDRDATVTTLAGLLAASAAPTFNEGMVEAIATSVRPEAGVAVLARWTSLGASARRRAVAMLCQRAEWTHALLAAIEKGDLQTGDVEPQRWPLLEQHPDAAIAAKARSLHARPAEDRAALVLKLMAAAERAGDATRGAALYKEQCAACHQLGGVGGVIGPHLDGIGARARRDTLLAIVDPNQSVEANYVLWIVATKDGSVLSGRLDAETRTTIELLDLVGQRHVIPRSELRELRSAMRSLMPDTFHLLGEQALADLLEYLAGAHGEKK